MVSSVLGMTAAELATTLREFKQTYANDSEYEQLRRAFPEDWPM